MRFTIRKKIIISLIILNIAFYISIRIGLNYLFAETRIQGNLTVSFTDRIYLLINMTTAALITTRAIKNLEEIKSKLSSFSEREINFDSVIKKTDN